MEMIKLIPANGCCKEPPPGVYFGDWWYFHGELSYRLGYDKGFSVGPLSNINSIIDVKVEGIPEECIGFFWTSEMVPGDIIQRGLVCLKSDREGCMWARDKYNKKPKFI